MASRRVRFTTALAALALPLGLLAGCSGDDESPQDPQGDPQAGASESGEDAPQQKIRRCKVEAEVSGAATATASGKGRALVNIGSGPDALYQFEAKGLALSVYSEGEDFSPNVSVVVDGATYTTGTEQQGLKVKTNGKAATVDAAAHGVDESAEVQVVAQFRCK